MMNMEITELRPGNIIHHEWHGFVEVCGTNAETDEVLLEANGQGGWWGIDEFEPVPLSSELLNRCGFTMDASYEVPLWSLGKFELCDECGNVPYSMRYN